MTGRAYLLLLLPPDFFSPAILLRLLVLSLLPLARSVFISVGCMMALAPLLAASERPLLPAEDLDLRDGIEVSLIVIRGRRGVRQPQVDSRSGSSAFCRL